MSSKTTWWYKLKYKFTKWLWKKESTVAQDLIAGIDWRKKESTVMYPPHLNAGGVWTEDQKRTVPHYVNFAGVDTKIGIRPTESKYPGGITFLHTVQAISFLHTVDEEPSVQGTIIFVMFDHSVWPQLQSYNGKDMILRACDEFGHMSECILHEVKFNTLGYGIAIDDIVTEEQVNYSAKSITPWRSMQRVGE